MPVKDGRTICDSCGKEITEEEIRFQSPLHILHHFGYGSIHDTDKVEAFLCMECADAFLPVLVAFCKHSGKSIVTDEWCGNYLFVEEEEEFYKQLVGEMQAAYGEELGNCNQ